MLYRKNIIKTLAAVITILMLLPLLNFTVSAFEWDDLEIYDTFKLYGEDCDVVPFVKNGHIMVPFRALGNTLGAVIEWDDESQTARAIYKSNALNLEISVFTSKKPFAGQYWNRLRSDMNIIVNGIYFPVFFKIPAEIIKGRLFIPADFFKEILGAKISIDENSNITIVINEDNFFEAARCESEKVEIIRLVNEFRIENGLKELKRNILLDEICRLKAIDKATFKYLGHKSEIYGTPAEMLGEFTEKLKFTGECLGWGQKTSFDIVEGWLNSPGHRSAILSENAQYIGVGTVTGENGVIYWAFFTAKT